MFPVELYFFLIITHIIQNTTTNPAFKVGWTSHGKYENGYLSIQRKFIQIMQVFL